MSHHDRQIVKNARFVMDASPRGLGRSLAVSVVIDDIDDAPCVKSQPGRTHAYDGACRRKVCCGASAALQKVG